MLKLTDQTQIPYNRIGEASTSLVARQTEFACCSLGSFLALIKSGQLRALMVTNHDRMESMPDVPAASELGYAEMGNVVSRSAVFGLPNMPAPIRDSSMAVRRSRRIRYGSSQ